MVYNSFQTNILTRIGLLVANLMALSYLVIRQERFFTLLFLALTALIQIILLFVYLNRTNRNLARFLLLLTHEDISAGLDAPEEDRRGLAGCIPLYKVAGAAAEAGKSLDEVYEIAERLTGEHHQHLVCIRCGVAVDIAVTSGLESAIDRLVAATEDLLGCEVAGHRLELEGVCAACRQ